jgi:hypothetical protein
MGRALGKASERFSRSYRWSPFQALDLGLVERAFFE